MQFKYFGLLSVLAFVKGADDADFLTDLVNDYKDHTSDYFNFIRTASSIPGVLTSLALEVATYTDDSYTTLLDNSGIDVSSLRAFATDLPWFSRIEDQLSGQGSSDDHSATSGSSSKSSSSPSSSTAASSSSAGGVGKVAAPISAILGVVAVALM